MIRVEVPGSYGPERRYVLDVLLGRFLGLEARVEESERDDTRLSIDGRGSLHISEGLFETPRHAWLRQESIPSGPLARWDLSAGPLQPRLTSPVLPVLFGHEVAPGSFVRCSDDRVDLGLDVPGSAFFMLTRYEEAACQTIDAHARFPASASVASREGFLDRPIVDEYLEVLWTAMERLWPNLPRRAASFAVHPTHDVDEPFAWALSSKASAARRFAGDLLERRSPRAALKGLFRWGAALSGVRGMDPYDTFEKILGLSEAHGLRSAFFFPVALVADPFGSGYSLGHPLVRRLLRRIHERGHEIGLHPSYDTHRDSERLRSELRDLVNVCEQEGIRQERWGSRQHYLRWETPTTFRALEEAGIAYDSSLVFADRPGFRCGVAREYPAFDLHTRTQLSLLERPPILMEHSVLGPNYMGLAGMPEEAFGVMHTLKERCRQMRGAFTVLWHNTHLVDPVEVRLYERLLDASGDPMREGSGASAAQGLRVAFVLESFPTFIIDEILELRRQGAAVVPLSVFRPRPASEVNPAVGDDPRERDLRRESLYFPPGYEGVLPAVLSFALRSPVLLAKLALSLLREGESLRLLVLAAYFAKRLEQSAVEHVHATYGTRPATLAWLVARLSGTTFSFTTHAHDIFLPNPTLPRKARSSRFVRTVSHFNRRFMLERCVGLDPRQVRVVHLGVDTRRFAPAAAPKGGAPLRIVSVGSLIPKKGHMFLLGACEQLVARGLDVQLDIVGENVRGEALVRAAAGSAIARRVRFLGVLTETAVRQHLAEAHVFCLACVDLRAEGEDVDGIPVALMEAMAMGKAVVSTRVSGIPELVEDGVSGLLVPERDAVALADALQRALTDPDLEARLGAGARRRVEELFNLRRNAAAFAALFREPTAPGGDRRA